MKKSIKITTVGIISLLALSGCEDDAQVASYNLSKAADNFEVQRRVVVINAFTSEALLLVEGRCSIEDQKNQLEVVCKHGPEDFRKHFVGIADNSPYVVEQLGPMDVNVYHTRITLKPQGFLPDVDFRGSTEALGDAVTPDSSD